MTFDPIWEKRFQQNVWAKYPSEPLIRFVSKNFYQRNRKEVKILELGCGPGPNIWYMAKEGFDVYGIDGSETAIQRAEERLNKENLHSSLTVGDISKLPYSNDFLDAVIDNECLYCNNFRDTEQIMKEIRRSLKDGGLFFSKTFSSDTYIGSSQTKIGPLEYSNISDGPFGGGEYVRLIDRENISNLYGKFFNILAIDKSEYTINNSRILISEWIIISGK